MKKEWRVLSIVYGDVPKNNKVVNYEFISEAEAREEYKDQVPYLVGENGILCLLHLNENGIWKDVEEILFNVYLERNDE